MTMRVRTAAFAAGLALLFGTAAGVALAAQPAFVAAAVADPARPAADTARDVNRKPAEVLAWAGVKPGDRIGEIFPGGGYYTRMLSKIVGPTGKLYAISPASFLTRPGATEALKAIGPNVVVIGSATVAPTPEIPEKLDLVWTTENYHDFHNAGGPGGPVADIAAFNKAVYDSLKPGGIYLIEDHAAANDAPPTSTSAMHRINPNQVVTEVTAAGFKLIARSDMMNVAEDDHTKPVFDSNVKGKTDKLLMKFQKPK